jgi:hypothetical protein
VWIIDAASLLNKVEAAQVNHASAANDCARAAPAFRADALGMPVARGREEENMEL